MDPFGRRARSHRLHAYLLRLLLAALTYSLMINLRCHALQGTTLAQREAAVLGNTRRVRVMLARICSAIGGPAVHANVPRRYSPPAPAGADGAPVRAHHPPKLALRRAGHEAYIGR